MKEQTVAFARAEVLLPAGFNRMQQFAHVLLPVEVTIVVVHLHALLPVFRQARLQEVAVHVQATATLHLPEARVHILHLPEVAAVVVAVDRSVAEVVVAVQVAVAAVVQVDADNERDNNYSIRACIRTCALIYLRY